MAFTTEPTKTVVLQCDAHNCKAGESGPDGVELRREAEAAGWLITTDFTLCPRHRDYPASKALAGASKRRAEAQDDCG